MKLNSGFHFNVNNTALGWSPQTAPAPTRIAISAYADGTGKVNVTCSTHNLTTGDIVVIQGTTSYNGVWAITKIGATSFSILATWVANDGASEFSVPASIELSRSDVKVIFYTDKKLYYRFSLTDNTAGILGSDDLDVVDTDLFVGDTSEKSLYIPWGITSHKDDKIYLLLIPAAVNVPVISAVVQ